MKKNFPRKKLDLNKQTIVTLTSVEIKRIRGGSDQCTTQPIPTCKPCPEERTIDTNPATH